MFSLIYITSLELSRATILKSGGECGELDLSLKVERAIYSARKSRFVNQIYDEHFTVSLSCLFSKKL